MALPLPPAIDPGAASDLIGGLLGVDDPITFLAVGGVVMARIFGFMMVAPFFGSMNIPMTARVGFVMVLTAITVPYVQGAVAPAMMTELDGGGALTYLLLLVNQILVGVMLGFVGAFIFYAIESAGRVIDTQRGSNMTDIIAPQSGERTSPSGQYLMMVGLMVFVISGLHMTMLEGILNSFKIFPPTLGLEWLGDPLANGNAHPELHSVINEFAVLSGHSLQLTVQIAGPVMITLMLNDVMLGIINRGAPQVNVFALSMVIKGPIGIAALMIALLPIMTYLQETAIPRISVGEHSIPAMAQRMDDANRAAVQQQRDKARDFERRREMRGLAGVEENEDQPASTGRSGGGR